MTNTDEYAKARWRAAAKYRFFVHAAVFAAVMVLLMIIDLVASPGNIWFAWPLVGWGLALGLHGVRVYYLADGNDIVDALTERELRQSGMGTPEDGPPRKRPK